MIGSKELRNELGQKLGCWLEETSLGRIEEISLRCFSRA